MERFFPKILACIQQDHDPRWMAAAIVVCTIGVYATIAVLSHAARSSGREKRMWGLVSVLAAGCTAWATHFIVLLAFQPGLPAAFEPVLTIASLTSAVIGIGLGLGLVLTWRKAAPRFLAGVVMGCGIVALHYLGQAAYFLPADVSWNLWLVGTSVVVGLLLSGLAIMASGLRNRRLRPIGPPLLLLSIAVIHFSGMAAMVITPDPTVIMPVGVISVQAITPVVSGVSLGLLLLAIIGWRFDLAARAGLASDRRRLRELSDVAFEGLLICQGDAVITSNDSFERLSGYGREALVNASLKALLPGVLIARLAEHEEHEVELITESGQQVPVRILRRDVTLGRKAHTVVAVRDQRERLKTEAEMRTLAFSDPLTGLLNRTRFSDRLASHALSHRDRVGGFGVLMVDLDQFKLVNDTLGHQAGDLMLREVASRLQALVGASDLIARLGGDEFAVLQAETPSVEVAGRLAEGVIHALSQHPFDLAGQAVYISASVGVAFSSLDGDDPAELLRRADVALYAAKSDGRQTSRHYDATLDDRMRARRALEADLRLALARDELDLHYQPLVDAVSGEVCAVEALVRWHHPDRGIISPIEFISIAEETGLIVPMGEWVLRTACAEAAQWPGSIQIAVNLSPSQFKAANLMAVVQSALADAGLPASRLELEVTEGVLLSDEERTLQIFKQMRAVGIRMSMDDFGTGYSSLSYLRRFPFDKIKIDQSFLRQIPGDAESEAIVRAILTLSRCLGLSTTVEGVETAAQFDFCVAEGFDSLQGYYMSRPLTATALVPFIADRACKDQAALAA